MLCFFLFFILIFFWNCYRLQTIYASQDMYRKKGRNRWYFSCFLRSQITMHCHIKNMLLLYSSSRNWTDSLMYFSSCASSKIRLAVLHYSQILLCNGGSCKHYKTFKKNFFKDHKVVFRSAFYGYKQCVFCCSAWDGTHALLGLHCSWQNTNYVLLWQLHSVVLALFFLFEIIPISL